MTIGLLAAAAGLAGFVVYTGARLGLWAPKSHESLCALMGQPTLVERVALVLATSAVAFYVLQQALRAT